MSNKNSFSDTSAKSYSQALYELALEEKSLKEVEENVHVFTNLISKSKDFSILIKDPTYKQDEQINIINIIFQKFQLNELSFKKTLSAEWSVSHSASPFIRRNFVQSARFRNPCRTK